MRATRPRRKGLTIALLAALAFGAIACEATPMDMWITMNPDAGADFDAPPRDVGRPDAGDDTSGTGGTGGSDGTGGTGGTGGTSGAAGDTGSGTAGTTGSGGGGTGGDAGSGGGAGTVGAAGNN
jgi:hypothetical protein